MAVDPQDLDDFMFNSDVSGEYYGEYSGRGDHKGFAVSLDSTADLFALGVAMGKDPLLESLQDHKPHIDNLGHGIVVSWPMRLFTTT